MRKIAYLAEKFEREQIIKQHDDQLRKLREQLKSLKAEHVAANKDVQRKEAIISSRKKEKGNKMKSYLTEICDEDGVDDDAWMRLNKRYRFN